MTHNNQYSMSLLQQSGELSRFQRWRLLKDSLAGKVVIFGGLGVIVAIVLIFFYLLYVVFPLFNAAHIEAVSEYQLPEASAGKTVLLAMEEQNEVAVRFTAQGKVVFFAAKTGAIINVENITVPDTATIVSFAQGMPAHDMVGYGLSDGRAIIVKHQYKVTYPNDQRLITPVIEYPFGTEPLVVDEQRRALQKLAFRVEDRTVTLVAKVAESMVVMSSFVEQESMFSDDVEMETYRASLDSLSTAIEFILVDKEQRILYLADRKGSLSVYNIADKESPKLIQHLNLIDQGAQISNIEFLNAELSLLVSDDQGRISQWTMVRDEKNQYVMQSLRSFDVSDSSIVAINAEQRRKGFMTVDKTGHVGIFHSTANRELINEQITTAEPVALTQSPRATALLVQTLDNTIHFWHIENEHPDVSISSIWNKVWYESYPGPDFIWQSSSASNDFEPKMSLTPLVFGTLKAAFYAMLMAIPLAIAGAIYTAYFMAPQMRNMVKPSIELMEALPTVILGFLAGLWLAPFVEKNLLGIFSLFLITPSGILFFAFTWELLPKSIRYKVPDGWGAALLIPVIILTSILAFYISPTLERWFFDGDMRNWMSANFGIGYDQRNSIVVGLAMGFAVIPTIFSIAEDAIFSVPKNLTVGSLALGATPWQTMTRVVLLTASPGIFSAIMIGFGRAVGETMIVLMATGNTPVMDLSIFQGMRTLSANIAVEMPESEVDSTHYRVLFLAALVLFMFTFVFNTLAELIRQNLREKYSSL